MEKTIIFGGPGCGKTYYLLNLIEELLATYKPHEIAFVSFTRAGAYNGRSRAMEKFGYSEQSFPYFRTLHSIAFQQGQLSKTDVVTSKEYYAFSKAIGMKFTGYYTEDFTGGDDIYLFYYFLFKNNALRAKDIEIQLNTKTYAYVESMYNKFKLQRGLTDYTDMIEHFVQDKKALPVKIAIIDEAQDLTTLQWQMCSVAFRSCEKVYIAGDDDQAVYEWNGADVERFLNIKGKRVILDKSYRMPSRILLFAQQISDRITKRVVKNFQPREEGGDIFMYNSIEDVPVTRDGEWYLLARNNYHLDEYREHLKKKGILFSDKGVSSIQKTLIQAIRMYEHRRQTGECTEINKLKIQQKLKRNADITLPWYDTFELDTTEIDYIRDILANNGKLEQSKITVNTFHGVKGGEADNVVVVMSFTRRVSQAFDDAMDSELRCLYVGCTRSKKNLHIVFKNSQYGYEDVLPIREMVRRAYEGTKTIRDNHGNFASFESLTGYDTGIKP